LATINVLLAFSLINALFGIANTMALSVIERTRELGLLRAVGMSRQQVRRMVRWESIIVASFGAALGIALGLLFGVALAQAMPDNVVSTTAVPFPVIAQIGLLAVLFGLLAALLPARRAARLNVLQAIATE
jgi:putative ABC transport system permease protein